MRLSSLIARLWANWFTILGSIVALLSGFGFVALLVLGLSQSKGNPYVSALVIVVMPALFAAGMLLIGIGFYQDRRHRGEGPADEVQAAFEAAFHNPKARNRILFAMATSIAGVALFSLAGHKTLTHMESVQFCGSCHVMQPEFQAFARSPHSNVECVECHVAPGAAGLVKSKWNGLHMLTAMAADSYSRPIVAQPAQLPPAKETCLHCHAPQRFRLDKVKLFPHYEQDKDNTPKWNAMLLKLGGLNPKTREWQGIHWHANPDNQIKFEVLDPQIAKIGKITVFSKGQLVAEYLPREPAQPIAERTMDCIDCHNRPTHTFDFTPRAAVDRALFANAIDPKTPYIAEVSAGVLAQPAAPRDDAEPWFRNALTQAYASRHPEVKPEPKALDDAAKALATLYRWNVYPAMNLTWNQHHSNISHKGEGLDNPGCFRCHDGAHEAALPDGKKKKLSQDCEKCHAGLAFDEDPAKFDDTLASMIPGAN